MQNKINWKVNSTYVHKWKKMEKLKKIEYATDSDGRVARFTEGI